MQFTKRTQLIIDQEVTEYYQNFSFAETDLDNYANVWKNWLFTTQNKILNGLDEFTFADFANGTSQTFDHFYLTNSQRQLVTFKGDFQYHQCTAKSLGITIVDNHSQLQPGQALIISAPFSDFGSMHPEFDTIMALCDQYKIPVCLDLAYWGIARNINLDLKLYPAITQITSSLSKPFHSLEKHRVGIRLSKIYLNDGISMINEVGLQNSYSMSLGCYFMKKFSCDWAWNKYQKKYTEICQTHELEQTDTVIFALGDTQRHSQFNRGIPGNHRICISDHFI